jgi:hypothetical protein
MNKLNQWIDKHRFLSIIIGLSLLPFIVIYKPYKATNPSNPLFVESWFDINDYQFQQAKLGNALKKLLPVGTSKKRVDQILVNYGGTNIMDNRSTAPGFFGYTFQPWGLSYDPLRIDAYYNEQDKLDVLLLNRVVLNGDFEIVRKRYKERKSK